MPHLPEQIPVPRLGGDGEGDRMRGALGEVVILADDLSGAAETAATLAPGVPDGIAVLLATGSLALEAMPSPVAIDTDTRSARPEDAARVLTAVLSAVPRDRVLVKKVDSLLRGNVAAEVQAIARAGRSVVLAPSLPRLSRVLRDGRLLVHGEPLRDTPAWRLEALPAPGSLLEILPDAIPVPLAAVREGHGLRLAVEAAAPGTVLVCDAETDADLERIAEATLDARRNANPGLTLAGSSALAAALGRLLGAPEDGEIAPGAVSILGRASFVLGTGEPQARAQVETLRRRGANVVTLDPLRLLDARPSAEAVAAARIALEAPVSVLTLDSGTIVDPSLSGLLTRRLAELVAAVFGDAPPALLTLAGGQTARAVLSALGIDRLTVRGTVNGGAALSTTDAGMTVITRPGSFGDSDDLVRILERIAPAGYSTLGT
jgi:uncharacterized protein YgbK (DUF1537 family)